MAESLIALRLAGLVVAVVQSTIEDLLGVRWLSESKMNKLVKKLFNWWSIKITIQKVNYNKKSNSNTSVWWNLSKVKCFSLSDNNKH